MLILLACTTPDPTLDTAVEQTPLPDVWGPEAAPDLDPAPDVVEVHMTAGREKRDWLGDGNETWLWTYNGQMPGPLIHATVGDTLRVVFTNNLDEPTTIHWHGLRIDNAMDGVPAIQDPVEPGETFVYEFVLPDAGSYWYHPHVRTFEQVERGLQGALVVHEKDPVDIPERYFVVDDAWLEDDGTWGSFALNSQHMQQMAGRFGNRLVVNGSLDPLEDEVTGVERWRIVNTANARTMYIDLEDAEWRVIAVDGTLLPEPYSVNRVELPVGRRVDLEVLPGANPVLNVTLPDTSTTPYTWNDYPIFLGTREGDVGRWNAWNAEPLPAMEEVEQELELVFSASGGGSNIDWEINGAVYGDHDTIPVRANTPTLIRLEETSGRPHPFHLHGQFFQVVERDGKEYPTDVGLLDTVEIGGKEELLLYSTFDNPGLWMAHCHILEHAERGMMTELLVE